MSKNLSKEDKNEEDSSNFISFGVSSHLRVW